jgi:Abortive infection alpha
VQREETLTRIAENIVNKGVSGRNPIPTKFVVAFLEKASLENPDDPLVELWSELLESAASEYGSHHLHFVSIINQMDAREADLFRKLIGTDDANNAELGLDQIRGRLSGFDAVNSLLSEFRAMERWTADDIEEKIIERLNRCGVEPVHAAFDQGNISEDPEAYYEVQLTSNYEDKFEVDYDILESIGLIKRIDTGWLEIHDFAVTLSYYHLTVLGFEFARACGIIKANPESSRESRKF